MANPHAIPITLSADGRARLQGWVRRRKTGQALATRARIVLACAAPGGTNGGVAERPGVSRPTVALWRRRFAERGPGGLLDEPRPGAPRKVTDGPRWGNGPAAGVGGKGGRPPDGWCRERGRARGPAKRHRRTTME